jgi:hypothetical protein
MAYASAQNHRDLYAGSTASAIRLDWLTATAAAIVATNAPPPSPEPSDYADKAKWAELTVGQWLHETGGYVTGKSPQHLGSKSYDNEAVLGIVAAAMGPYFVDPMATVHVEAASF